MPRSETYYQDRAYGSSAPAVSAKPAVPAQQQNTGSTVLERATQSQAPTNVEERFRANYDREDAFNAPDSPLRYIPEEFARTVMDLPDRQTWSQMSGFDKTAAMSKASLQMGWDMLKGIPAAILKSPLKVSQSAFDLTDLAVSSAQRALGATEEQIQARRDYMGFSKSYNLPALGEIRGVQGAYEEGRATGLSPGMSVVKSGSELAGDITIALSLVEGAYGAVKPRFKTVSTNSVTGPDFRPLTTQQVETMRSPLDKIKSALKGEKPTSVAEGAFVSKQNPNTTYIPASSSVAKRAGGTSQDTFLKITPKGNGMAEYSIVQMKPSYVRTPIEALKKRFGSSRVVNGPNGPEVIIQSGSVRYNPQTIGKSATEDLPQAMAANVAQGDVAPQISMSARRIGRATQREQIASYAFPDEGMNASYEIFKSKVNRNKNVISLDATGYLESNLKPNMSAEELEMRLFQGTAGGSMTNDDLLEAFKKRYAQEKSVESRPLESFIPKEMLQSEQAKVSKAGQGSPVEMSRADVSDPIISEARKYKSAEEFVNSQNKIAEYSPLDSKNTDRTIGLLNESGIPVKTGEDILTLYHGTNAKGVKGINKSGRLNEFSYLATDKNASSGFVYGRGGDVLEIKVPVKDAGFVQTAMAGAKGATIQNPVALVKGTDGIWRAENWKTKSQLTDIWNKAQQANPAFYAPGSQQGAMGIVQRPMKGLADQSITDKQMSQIGNVQKDVQMDDLTLQAIIKVQTGKSTLQDLTQAEAYDVSEAVRAVNKSVEQIDKTYLGRQWLQRSRDLFDRMEVETRAPVYSQVYLPITTGIRLSESIRNTGVERSREVFGKYAGGKYHEHRRLLSLYTTGDKGAIQGNSALSSIEQQELSQIGDWLIEEYRKFHQVHPEITEHLFQNMQTNMSVESNTYLGNYSPNIKKRDGVYPIYKTAELPAEIKPFFEFERTGMLAELEDDALALYDMYVSAYGKRMMLEKPMSEAQSVIKDAPRNVQEYATGWTQEVMGFRGKLEESLDNMGKSWSNRTNGFVKKDVFHRMIEFVQSNMYAGALGLPRVANIPMNFFQQVMTYAEFGPEAFLDGLKWASKKENKMTVKKKGFLVEKGVTYGSELSRSSGSGPIGRATDFIKKINGIALAPQGWADAVSRYPAYGSTVTNFNKFWGKFRDGEISYAEFQNGIDMKGFSQSLQKVLHERFMKNTPESLNEAVDLMARAHIDDVQFPYRRGEEGKAHYGLRGKLGMALTSWTFEYVQTLGKWAGQGQWMKIIRWLGASAALKRGVEDSTGIDLSRWLGVTAINGIPMGPMVKMMLDVNEQFFTQTAEEQKKNWQDIANGLRLYGGVATGLGAQSINKLLYSVDKRIEAEESGNVRFSEDKPFGIYTRDRKRVIRYVDFSELLKVTFGFPTKEGEVYSTKITEGFKEKDRRNALSDKAYQLFKDGKYQQAFDIVEKNNLSIDFAGRLKNEGTDLKDRAFSSFDTTMKMKYMDIFYPPNE